MYTSLAWGEKKQALNTWHSMLSFVSSQQYYQYGKMPHLASGTPMLSLQQQLNEMIRINKRDKSAEWYEKLSTYLLRRWTTVASILSMHARTSNSTFLRDNFFAHPQAPITTAHKRKLPKHMCCNGEVKLELIIWHVLLSRTNVKLHSAETFEYRKNLVERCLQHGNKGQTSQP
jgi:hypothetical protein